MRTSTFRPTIYLSDDENLVIDWNDAYERTIDDETGASLHLHGQPQGPHADVLMGLLGDWEVDPGAALRRLAKYVDRNKT